MDELRYIKFRANESTPLSVLKNGTLKDAGEKHYVKKGTVIVGALNTITIEHEGNKHQIKVIQTKEGKYAPVKLFNVYVDEFSRMNGDRNVVYKTKVYQENRLLKYGLPLGAAALGFYLARKRGVRSGKLVLTVLVSTLLGLTPYFYLKNKRK